MNQNLAGARLGSDSPVRHPAPAMNILFRFTDFSPLLGDQNSSKPPWCGADSSIVNGDSDTLNYLMIIVAMSWL